MRKKLFYLILLLAVQTTASIGQLQQFHIGDTGYQIATAIRFLPNTEQRAVIIAGYKYDVSGTTISNCQAIIMKVTLSGTIAWQKTFGIPGKDNLIQDMTITEDGNIVVVGIVGRTSQYAGNVAAIMKYSVADGSVLWQKCMRDAANTAGGEIFFGVTQLHDGSGKIVTVGSHDFTPSGSSGMICVFQNDGTFLYNEVRNISNGDEYVGVVADSLTDKVYICGQFVGNYKDIIVHSYTPGASSGSLNWSKAFDFTVQTNKQNNHAGKIFTSGSKLYISGACFNGYALANGLGSFIFTINNDGTVPEVKGIQNNGAAYANSPVIAIAGNDHLYQIQSPAASLSDPISYTPGLTTNTVVNDITSISAGTTNASVMFTSADPGQRSMLDARYNNQDGLLYMAGSTDITSTYGKNDVYYIVTAPTLASKNHNCDTTHETISIISPATTSPTPSWSTSTFIPAYVTVDTGSTNFNIGILCGDDSIKIDTPGTTSTAAIINESEISIYPNPFTQTLTVNSPGIESITITNTVGQLVYSKECKPTDPARLTINTANLQSGIYFIVINKQIVKRILKQ